MFRRTLLATTLVLPLGLSGQSGTASADPDYLPNSPLVEHGVVHIVTSRLSCLAAKRIVQSEGYRHVQPGYCNSDVYAFHAERNGRPVVIHMNPDTGRITR